MQNIIGTAKNAHYDIFKSLEDMCGQGKIRYCYNNEGIRFENESWYTVGILVLYL